MPRERQLGAVDGPTRGAPLGLGAEAQLADRGDGPGTRSCGQSDQWLAIPVDVPLRATRRRAVMESPEESAFPHAERSPHCLPAEDSHAPR